VQVEQLISSLVAPAFQPSRAVFSSGGREDMDVRMLCVHLTPSRHSAPAALLLLLLPPPLLAPLLNCRLAAFVPGVQRWRTAIYSRDAEPT